MDEEYEFAKKIMALLETARNKDVARLSLELAKMLLERSKMLCEWEIDEQKRHEELMRAPLA